MAENTLQMYAFKAKDHSGRIQTGKMEAASVAAVRDTLRAREARTISIKAVNDSIWTREFHILGPKQAKLKDLALMARQFAAMLSAGVPLIRILDSVAEQTVSNELKRALKSVRNDVEGGVSLTEALGKHPLAFPPIMVHLVRSGEGSGSLDSAMLRIASAFEAEVKLRTKIKSAMTYPCVVGIFALVMLAAVLIWVVPIFENLYSGLGGTLPVPTRMLVSFANGFKWCLPIILIALAAMGYWWKRNKNRSAVRAVVDPMKLRLPVFGNLFQKVAMSRFARNFATLSSAGLPILPALDIVADTTGSAPISESVRSIQDDVRDSAGLAESMEKHHIFPPMVRHMVAVGEETSKLDELLDKIADFYDHEIEATTEALTSLIEPLLVVVMGVLIGALVLALYWPVFSIFSLIH